jgi:hypothetical protein
MARAIITTHQLKFGSLIRGHHISLSKYTPSENDILECRQDTSTEAQCHDKYAIGVLSNDTLVGHVPKEISSLLYHFIVSGSGGTLVAKPTGKRKRENGLVIPCIYTASGNKSENLKVLRKELENIKSNNPGFEISVHEMKSEIILI